MSRESRSTRQKKLLQEMVDSFTSFFSAEDLLIAVQKKDSSLSTATVYRFLKSAREVGSLHSYNCGGKTIYASEKTAHAHFICKSCNQIRHIQLERLDFLERYVPGNICHVQLDVTGVCDSCAKKDGEK